MQLGGQTRAQLGEGGKRGRAIAGLGQSPDQLSVGVLGERVMGDLAARPADRARGIAGLLRDGRQPRQRGDQLLAVPVSGGEDPLVVKPWEQLGVT